MDFHGSVACICGRWKTFQAVFKIIFLGVSGDDETRLIFSTEQSFGHLPTPPRLISWVSSFHFKRRQFWSVENFGQPQIFCRRLRRLMTHFEIKVLTEQRFFRKRIRSVFPAQWLSVFLKETLSSRNASKAFLNSNAITNKPTNEPTASGH